MSSEPEDLRAALTAVRESLLNAISGVSEDQFKRRPPSEDPEARRSIAEVLARLLYDERASAEKIAIALQQPGATFTPVSAGEREEAARAGRASPVPQLIHGLLASRREVERLLTRAATIEGGLDRAVAEPGAAPATIAEVLRTDVIAHEAEQIARIESIKAALAAASR